MPPVTLTSRLLGISLDRSDYHQPGGEIDPLFVLFHSLAETGKVKVIGIYSSRALAEEALERTRVLPGFDEEPDGFTIDQYEIDRDHWPRGFVRL